MVDVEPPVTSQLPLLCPGPLAADRFGLRDDCVPFPHSDLFESLLLSTPPPTIINLPPIFTFLRIIPGVILRFFFPPQDLIHHLCCSSTFRLRLTPLCVSRISIWEMAVPQRESTKSFLILPLRNVLPLQIRGFLSSTQFFLPYATPSFHTCSSPLLVADWYCKSRCVF